MTSVVGFGAACVLAMPVAESFGALIALSLLFVFLASVFVLPILLVGRKDRPPAASRATIL